MRTRRIAVRTRALSLRVDLRLLGVLALLGVATLSVLAFNIGRGDFDVSAPDVLGALVGAGEEATRLVVVELRLPRGLAALLVGAALGISGAILQDLARNPLVSPDITGVTSGASLAAVAVIVFVGASSALAVPLAALAGGLGAATLVYGLAWRNGLHGYRLVLVGIGATALLQAGISYTLARGEIFEVSEAFVWLVGSLNERDWSDVWPLAATLFVLAPLAFLLGRQLEALQLGDDMARLLGVGVERARLALIAVAVVLAAVSVSAAGPILFAAFIAPHLARRACGSVSPASVLPVAGATGALLVLSADVVGRLMLSPTGVPVGIVTSVLAAPYFLFLLQRANRVGASG